ncbi:Tyrosine recombinase XerD [anaerobic digester metagenome]
MLLKKAIETYLDYLKAKERSKETIRGYGQELNALSLFIEQEHNGAVYLDDIELKDLEGYLTRQKEKGSSAKTRSRQVSILRSFYAFLFKRDLVEKDISQKLESISYQEKERTHLTPEEMETLIENIDHPLVKTATITMANTGLRISELCKLTLNDVDFKKNLIQVRQGKGNKDRVIPINAKLKEELENYLKSIRPKTSSSFFFATTRTGRLSRQTVNETLIETVAKLGWQKHVTAHILRHSFASNLVRNQAPLPAVQKLLGHSNLTVTSRYIHQDLGQLQQAVNLI